MTSRSHVVGRSEHAGASRRQKSTMALSALTVLALFFGLFAAPLAAQTGSDNRVDFEVLHLDVSGEQGSVAVRPATGAESGDLTVEIEGEEIVTTVSPIFRSPVATQTVIVIDDSQNANDVAGFGLIREAALAYVDGLSADTRVMLVRAGGGRLETQPVVPFTGDHASIRQAINELTPGGGSVTFNAIADSASFFSAEEAGVRNVVAFVGSTGGNSTRTPEATRGSLVGASAGLTVVAPRTTNLDISAFASVANAVRGGAVFRGESAESDMTVAARNAIATHEGVLVGTFPTDSIIDVRSDDGQGEDGTNELIARYDGGAERVRLLPGSVVSGSLLDAPQIAQTSRFAIVQGNTVALIAIAAIVIAVLIFAFTLMSILIGADNTLTSTLSVYGSPEDRTEDQKAADDAFASNRARIIEQVVERAEEAAEARGNLDSATNMLEKAEIPLRVGEAFAIQVGLVIVAFGLGFLLGGANLIGGLLLAIPAAVIPTFIVKSKVKKRSKRIEAQLPDTLNLLSSTLKAGYSFIQGMDAVGNEAEEPLAGEFRRTVNEARLGKEMDVALDDLAERIDSQDMLWAIVAIKIQREVGGNLAELLSTVAETMQSRSRLRGEVNALTAEGRISSYVLLGLPFAVAFAMYFLNPEYLSELWTTGIGIGAVVVAMVSMAIGSAWMRKIIDIQL